MRTIERGDVMGLADYETIRDRFRARVIEDKKRRRVAVGDHVTALFENRDTVLLQIQEMLRTERITKESGIEHELATYNQLLPGPHELSATMMIEIPDATEREEFLEKARGFEQHVALYVDGERIQGTWDESRVLPDRASAVLYIKFPLTSRASEAIRRGPEPHVPKVELVVDHPVYAARAALAPEPIVALAEDLDEGSGHDSRRGQG
jgi:hypothetical protein